MNTQIEHLENHTARLTVEATQEQVAKAMQDAARRIAREVNIPGFRKGKAPYNVILQRFGQKVVFEEALEKLGNDLYRTALDESGIEPYAPATLENVEAEPTVKLIFIIPKKPETTLGNYRELRESFEVPEVQDSDLNEAITRLQEQRALVETVTRPVQMGDIVKVAVYADTTFPVKETEKDEKAEGEESAKKAEEQPEAKQDDEEQPAEVIDAAETALPGDSVIETVLDEKELPVLMTDDPKRELLPGFTNNVIGMNAGETKEFELAIPEDYEDKEIAGHTVKCKVEIKEVQSRTLPVLNDEFAKQVGEGKSETLLDLRINVRKEIQHAMEDKAKKDYADKLFERIIEQATIKFPEAMVEEYIDDLLKEMDQYLHQNNLSLERYMLLSGKTPQDMREMNRERAIQRAKSTLVFAELARVEQITVNDEDIQQKIDELSAQFGEQAAAFRTMFARPDSQRNIAMNLISERVNNRIVEIGQGKAPDLSELAEHTHDHSEHTHDHSDAQANTAEPTATQAEQAE